MKYVVDILITLGILSFCAFGLYLCNGQIHDTRFNDCIKLHKDVSLCKELIK